MLKTFYTLLLIVVNTAFVLAQENILRSGPMTGYSTMREVELWVQTTKPAKVRFEFWDENTPGKRTSTEEITTSKSNEHIAKIIAAPLEPGKKYNYDLVINGKKVKTAYPLKFQSQPLWQWRSDPPDFKFALGSCYYANEEVYDRPGKPYGSDYKVFESIYKESPDFMLWLGDNVYLREADWDSRTGIMHRFSHTRSVKELQPLLGSAHHFAIWDDHDFGPNDSDRSYPLKNVTLEAFKLFWSNPNYALGEKGGITGTFSWNDIDFFLLDNRYFRTPNKNYTGERTQLGEDQFQWLIDALINSRSPFKFIVIGGQVINPGTQHETLETYKEEKERLFKSLKDADIHGVFFLTGDVHHTILHKMERDGLYPIYDLSVSPLTSGTYSPREKNEYMVDGTLFTERNYGIIEVTGPRTARKLRIKIKNVDGKDVWQKEIEARDLK
jgi:alkaline phosphatase D